MQNKDKYTFKGLSILHPMCLHTETNTGQIHMQQIKFEAGIILKHFPNYCLLVVRQLWSSGGTDWSKIKS